jgi:uncharacterized protein (DUF58 family)
VITVLQAVRNFATRFTLERRLAIALVCLSPLWLLPSPIGVYAGLSGLLVLVLVLVFDFLQLPPRAGVHVERDFPINVGVGDDVSGAYTVSNRSGKFLAVDLFDRFPSLLRGGVGRTTVMIDPDTQVEVPVNGTGLARGSAPLGAIGIRFRTKVGLVAASYQFDSEHEVRVIPSMSGVRRYRLLAMQQKLHMSGARQLRRKGSGQAFANLREYVRGDDPRFIDWKATSRKDKLITREFTIERSQTVITLLDAGRGMTQLSGEFSRFEHALSAALILTDVASNSGDRVGTMVFDDEVRAFVPPQASRGALQLVRDAFIPVVATTREPDYATAFRYLATHLGKRSLIVFFTDVIDVRASQALLAHVTRSSARHLVLVVALRNDALHDAARRFDAATAQGLYESAAAEEVIQARDEVLLRMRRAGIIVLDVSPKQMTASVVNQYLELKNRGAL